MTTTVATPDFGSSTSTRTGPRRRLLERSGIRDLPLRRRGRRLDTARSWRARPASAGALPKIVRDGTNNGFFVHSRHLWWQNEDTAKLPNLVDRRSFNDLLKDVEPRGKIAGGVAEIDPGRARIHGRAGRHRAAGQGPDRLRVGSRRQALGRRDGRLPAGSRRQGQTRRRRPVPGRHRRRRPVRQADDVPRRAGLPDRRDALAQRACWSPALRISSTPRTATATARPTIARCSSPALSEGNQQHRLNGFELGLDGWIYGANGDSGGSVRSLKTGKTHLDQRPRLPVSARHRRVRGRERPDAVRPAPRRLGPLVRQQQPQLGLALRPRQSRPEAQPPSTPPPDPRQTLEPDTRLYPDQPHAARFNDLGTANHVTSANSPTPYRDDLFGPEFATSLFVSEPVHNLVHRMVLEPDGVTLPRPSRAERVGPRVPGLERQLVPADDAQDRPRRRTLDRRHVPRRHRAPRVDSRRLGEAARPPRRQRSRGGSIASTRSTKSPGRSPARQARRRRDSSPRSTAPAAGSATRRSGCSCTAATPPRSRPPRTLAIETKRPKTRVQAIWTLADLGGSRRAIGPGRTHRSRSPGARERDRGGRAARLAQSRVASRCRAPTGRRRRCPRPLPARAGAGQLGRSPRGRGPGAPGGRDGNDPWMRAAILSSAVPHVATLLAELLGGHDAAMAAAAPRRRWSSRSWPWLARCPERADRGGRSARSADRRGRGGGTLPGSSPRSPGCSTARDRAGTPLGELDLDKPFAGLWEAAHRLVADESAAEADRLAAVALLGHAAARDADDRDLLVGLLRPQVAGRAPAGGGARPGQDNRSPRSPTCLLRDWKRLLAAGSRRDPRRAPEPTARGQRRCSRRSKTAACPAAEIDPARRQQLLTARDPTLRSRAEAVFAHQTKPRQAVVDGVSLGAAARRATRPPARSSSRSCASSCHRLGNEGVEVGPDLASLQRQVARVALDRHPRPQPGIRVEVRQLLGRDGRRPRLERTDRQRVGHVGDPPPPGRQGRRPAPLRDRGDDRLGPVAHARRTRKRPETPATSPT